MKLSILDQAPISTNQTAGEALTASTRLAQAGERLGYTRYWIAEHHDLPGLACSVPEVMLSYIGANTERIRIGSGAILLPHYKPFKVAEIFNMLATLFPDRIDIGIGRAPGGSAQVTNALSDNFLQNVYKMPTLVKELLYFLDDDYPSEHDYEKIKASPVPNNPPTPWLLGTSKKSALLAAENGMDYTFGLFMSKEDGKEIIQQYKNSFQPRKFNQIPHVILTVSVICAETKEKAEELALSSRVWSIQKDKGKGINGIPSVEEAKSYLQAHNEDLKKDNIIIGNPLEVKKRLTDLQATYGADEIMIVTITHSPEDKIRSYELIAEALIN
ncbi:MAG: LLM class flavin-dependent oxidoreductase [Heyndrickxia sp.]